MELSKRGLDFIKLEEGFSPIKYRDAGGYSIGYGHFIRPNETFDEPMSREKGEEVLARDVAIAVDCVQRLIRVSLNQNQFDALVSFTYNCGTGALQRSTLRSLLNRGDYLTAANEFLKWKFSGGLENKALVARRIRERALFLAEVVMPIPEAPLPAPSAKNIFIKFLQDLTNIVKKGTQ